MCVCMVNLPSAFRKLVKKHYIALEIEKLTKIASLKLFLEKTYIYIYCFPHQYLEIFFSLVK